MIYHAIVGADGTERVGRERAPRPVAKGLRLCPGAEKAHPMDLRADQVTKRFGPVTALDRVSLAVEAGDSVAIHGPNGSGKTTLLRVLAGLSRPSEGTVTVGGTDRYSHEGRRAHSLGYLSHASMLYDDLTAAENLRFHARLHDVEMSRVTDLLETVDLFDRADGFPREFSHGMRKRLSLARALLADPDVLLLDEPFTGLDQHSREMLEGLIEDRTVVLVTHAPELSTALCNRFVVLDRGQVVARIDERISTPAAFRERYRAVLSP